MRANNSPPKFSIILPVRNGGEHIKLCVASILEQTYRNFELLILENYSSDGTVDWLKTINDLRVKIISAEEPLSLEDNWLRISSIKTNEFITIIGHDDVLDPHYLEVMSGLIKKQPAATLYQTHFRYINDNGGFLRHCLPMCQTQQMYEFIAKQFLRTLDSMGTGYMMRRKDFDVVGGFSQYPNLIFGDYDLWVKLISLGHIAIDPAECFSYREHASASAKINVSNYQIALFKYLNFLNNKAKTNFLLRDVIDRYGKDYLDYMCGNLIFRGISVKRSMESKAASEIVSDFDICFYEISEDLERNVKVSQRIKMGLLIDKWIIGRLTYVLVLKLKCLIKSLL